MDRHFGNNYLNFGLLKKKFLYERRKIEFDSMYNIMTNSVLFRGIFSINIILEDL